MDLEQLFSRKSDENNVKIVVIVTDVAFYRFLSNLTKRLLSGNSVRLGTNARFSIRRV